MSREFKILSILKNKFSKAPKPILFCDDEKIIGSSFYIMERIKGVILRGGMPKDELPEPKKIKDIVYDFISTMTELHSIDCNTPELSNFGKPEGYVKRQVRESRDIWGQAGRTGCCRPDTRAPSGRSGASQRRT